MDIQEQLIEAPVLRLAGPIPPRPTWSDEFVQKRTMELFRVSLREYLSDEDVTERDFERSEQHVIDCITRRRHSDGYERAKYLESHHCWNGDTQLVELMEEVDGYVSGAIRELTSQWMRVYEIKIPFKIGDQVKVIGRCNKGKSGTVTDIDQERGMVSFVAPEDVGSPSNRRFVNQFEDLSLSNE